MLDSLRFICSISVSMACTNECILLKYFLVNFFCWLMENKIEICSAFLFCMRQLFKTLPPCKGDEWTLTMVNLQMSAKFIPKLLGLDPMRLSISQSGSYMVYVLENQTLTTRPKWSIKPIYQEEPSNCDNTYILLCSNLDCIRSFSASGCPQVDILSQCRRK